MYRRQGFIYRKQVLTTASKVLHNSVQVFTHRKQVLCIAGKVVYHKQVSDYRKQGFTQLHPRFYAPQTSFMYRRQGFIYRKQVSDQGRSQDFISTEAKGLTGDLGADPQRGPGAEPLVRGSGGEAHLKLNAFQ